MEEEFDTYRRKREGSTSSAVSNASASSEGPLPINHVCRRRTSLSILVDDQHASLSSSGNINKQTNPEKQKDAKLVVECRDSMPRGLSRAISNPNFRRGSLDSLPSAFDQPLKNTHNLSLPSAFGSSQKHTTNTFNVLPLSPKRYMNAFESKLPSLAHILSIDSGAIRVAGDLKGAVHSSINVPTTVFTRVQTWHSPGNPRFWMPSLSCSKFLWCFPTQRSRTDFGTRQDSFCDSFKNFWWRLSMLCGKLSWKAAFVFIVVVLYAIVSIQLVMSVLAADVCVDTPNVIHQVQERIDSDIVNEYIQVPHTVWVVFFRVFGKCLLFHCVGTSIFKCIFGAWDTEIDWSDQ